MICSDPEQTGIHYGLRGAKLYTIQNCAAAAQNMLLAAHALGLGGVWVGAFEEEKIRGLLNIPQNARPQAIMAFGYPDEIPDHKRVKDLRIITYFNSYGATIRNMHHVLRDYSVDWEARIKQAHTAIDRFKEKAEKATAKAREDVGKKGGSFFQRYKEKIRSKTEIKKK